MSSVDWALLCLAFVIGVGGWRNSTAVALAASFIVPKLLWLFTGYEFGIEGLFRIDLAIVASIYIFKRGTPNQWCRRLKPDDGYPFRSFPHQLCALWLERTPYDRFVLLCFPAVWWFYGVDNVDVQFWACTFIWIAQILAAGTEAAGIYRNRRAANAVPGEPDSPQSGVEFAWAHGGGGDG